MRRRGFQKTGTALSRRQILHKNLFRFKRMPALIQSQRQICQNALSTSLPLETPTFRQTYRRPIAEQFTIIAELQ
jgi:hypothetical protein